LRQGSLFWWSVITLLRTEFVASGARSSGQRSLPNWRDIERDHRSAYALFQSTVSRQQIFENSAPSRLSAGDMQAQFMALIDSKSYDSLITETVFENRSAWQKLNRMGAVTLSNNAIVRGIDITAHR